MAGNEGSMGEGESEINREVGRIMELSERVRDDAQRTSVRLSAVLTPSAPICSDAAKQSSSPDTEMGQILRGISHTLEVAIDAQQDTLNRLEL